MSARLNRIVYGLFPIVVIVVPLAALLIGIFSKWYFGVAFLVGWFLFIHLPLYGSAKGWAHSFVRSRVTMFLMNLRKNKDAGAFDLFLPLVRLTCPDELAAHAVLLKVREQSKASGDGRITVDLVLMTLCVLDWEKTKKRPATDAEIQSFNDVIKEVIGSDDQRVVSA